MKTFFLIFRKLKKNKTATSLGIAGLVVGMMCVVYIFLLVTDEISFDRFHKKLDRIFVVHAYLEGGPEKVDFSGCPPAVATALKDEYPEVERTCRYIPPYFEYLITYGENKFIERTAISDFSLFDIFSFPFIYGGKGEASTPNRIILTRTAARKYFGDTDPVGKIVRMDNRIDMTVAGVIKDIPKNSSINFDAVIPLEELGVYYSRTDYLTTWYNNAFITFGLLSRPEGFEKVASTITRRIQKELPESTNFLRAYKFKDGYLYEQKHISNVRIFILIALLVLMAATLNFINLNTARSSKQAKETGLRKTFGASRMNVVRLIYSDVAMICFLAFALAILVVYIGLPLINGVIGKGISFTSLFSIIPLTALLAIYLLTVLLAGSYPAVFLSSFTPGQILSSNFQTVRSRGIFRNVLVVVMFVVSIMLLTSTLVISSQTDFLLKMDLGFEKDQLMYVSLKGKLQGQVQALKQEFGQSSGVISSAAVSFLPTSIGNNGENWDWEGKDPNFKPLVTEWETDEDLIKTFGAKMAEGDFLNKNQDGIVINKAFADLIGWKSYAGKTLKNGTTQYRLLGVVKDIHFNSLASATKPMAIMISGNSSNNYLVLKVNTVNIRNTIDYITKVCQTIEPSFPVEYAFLSDRYNQLLASEINLKKLVGIFSLFAILVLCLGMLGMVMFLIEQKTKEIGVRKCLGENVLSITGQLVKPFLISAIIAALIAIPLTWYILKHWLQNYAYHIQLNISTFVLAGIITIGIALLTILWQSWRAATRNPIEALRYE
jgi:putative ABC transport system permease protein